MHTTGNHRPVGAPGEHSRDILRHPPTVMAEVAAARDEAAELHRGGDTVFSGRGGGVAPLTEAEQAALRRAKRKANLQAQMQIADKNRSARAKRDKSAANVRGRSPAEARDRRKAKPKWAPSLGADNRWPWEQNGTGDPRPATRARAPPTPEVRQQTLTRLMSAPARTINAGLGETRPPGPATYEVGHSTRSAPSRDIIGGVVCVARPPTSLDIQILHAGGFPPLSKLCTQYRVFGVVFRRDFAAVAVFRTWFARGMAGGGWWDEWLVGGCVGRILRPLRSC